MLSPSPGAVKGKELRRRRQLGNQLGILAVQLPTGKAPEFLIESGPGSLRCRDLDGSIMEVTGESEVRSNTQWSHYQQTR
jgi:hypothetical protein